MRVKLHALQSEVARLRNEPPSPSPPSASDKPQATALLRKLRAREAHAAQLTLHIEALEAKIAADRRSATERDSAHEGELKAVRSQPLPVKTEP